MDLPLLGRVIETNVGGPGDLERPKRKEVDGLGVEALHKTTVRLEP
jgi:hypothetical protein